MKQQANSIVKSTTTFLKTILSLGIYFCLVTTTFANQTADSWENELTTQINKLLPSTAYSLDELTVSNKDKAVMGKGTFFKQSNIAFEASISQDGTIGTFIATMPSNAKVAINNSALSDLAGQNLISLIPNAIEKGIYLEQFSLVFNKKSKAIESVQLAFNGINNWAIFQGSTLQLEQIKVNITTDYPANKNQRKFKSMLTGITKIAGKSVNLSAQLTTKKEALILTGQTGKLNFKNSLEGIIGQSDIRGWDVPNVFFNIQLKDGTLNIAPYQQWMTLAANSNWGQVDIWTQKKAAAGKDGKKLDYVVAISTPKDFKISKIHANLKVLDRVSLANQQIVFSSAKKSQKEAKKVPILKQIKTGIRKGGSIIAKLDVRKLKLEHLLQTKELIVNSPLTAKLDGVVLEAPLTSNIQLGANAKLSEVLFRLKPAPKDFGIILIGLMNTQIGQDALIFKGGMEVDLKSQALNFSALMEGDWKNPLGAKGLVMTDIGMQMGASFTTAPVILPNIALTGQLKAGSFTGEAHLAFDTRNPTKSMLAASFNKVGLMDLINLVTSAKIRKGIPKEMQKTLKTINLSKVSMEMVPQKMEVLEKIYQAGFRTNGTINIAGFKGYTAMEIDYLNGILAKGSIDPIKKGVFELKGAKGNAKPSFILDLRKGKKAQIGINGLVSLMEIEGETDIALLPNGFKFKVGGQLFKLFKGDITATGKDLAQVGEIGLKVKMENDLLNFIDKETTKFIKNSTKGAVEKLTKAQKGLTKAQKEVKKINRTIKVERAIISKKMAAKRKKYDAAKKKLTAAQKKVNQLNKSIKKLKKQKNALKKHQVVKKSAINTKILALEGTRLTALGTLEAAKLAMSGFKGMNTNPDLHPKIVSLNASKTTALATLEGAKKTLEGIKWTLGITGNVASFAIEKGANLLINIKKIDFAGQLGKISGGSVKLNTDLEWMGKKQKLKLNFNLKNPTKSIEALGKQLLKMK